LAQEELDHFVDSDHNRGGQYPGQQLIPTLVLLTKAVSSGSMTKKR
jgi:hypothetical protein